MKIWDDGAAVDAASSCGDSRTDRPGPQQRALVPDSCFAMNRPKASSRQAAKSPSGKSARKRSRLAAGHKPFSFVVETRSASGRAHRPTPEQTRNFVETGTRWSEIAPW